MNKIDKSFLTNAVSLLIVLIGLVSPVYKEQIVAIGMFALSGALTNWVAIYMLFERVPLMYGSGVVPNRFEEFKAEIKKLIMLQFFNKDNLQRFIVDEEANVAKWLNAGKLVNKLDYDLLFDRLVEAIMQSSFGSMLGMFGGANALQGLRAPVIEKIKISLADMVDTSSFQNSLVASVDMQALGADMSKKIEAIVDKRLSELTPELVKQIVEDMIKAHLGWLVVWGGVLGALLGLLGSFLI